MLKVKFLAEISSRTGRRFFKLFGALGEGRRMLQDMSRLFVRGDRALDKVSGLARVEALT
jgi:hypothetical protein